MSRKLLLGMAIVAVALLAFGATVATAHTARFNTEIVVDDIDVDQFEHTIRIEGHLNSPREHCERFRRVSAFAVDRNGTETRADDDVTFIDADVTNENGVFVIQGPLPAGTDEIILFTPREVHGRGDHRHICRADRDVTFD